MTPNSFKQSWENAFPGCPPIGYFLRESFPGIWFRVHTLPSAKRYADSPEERAEVLRRHNLILSDLLTDGGEYLLITTGYSDSLAPVSSYPELDKLLPERQFIFSIAKNEFEKDPEPYYWHFFMTEMSWHINSADEILRRVADEALDNILFVGVEQQFVYSPYDGGADVFVKDDAKRNALRDKYAEWLPTNAIGL